MKETAIAAPEEHGWVVAWNTKDYGPCVSMFMQDWHTRKDAERMAAVQNAVVFTKEEFAERLGILGVT